MRKPPSNFIDLSGQKFGHLTVTGRAFNKPNMQAKWTCQCVCGKETAVAGQKLRSGDAKSCGCSKPGHVTHGKSRTKTHNSWIGMKQRCYYEKHAEFERYGGRGITVCERWQIFENFYSDMGERPARTSLDRINSNGNYEPENCRWAPDAQQARNRRSTILVERDGRIQCVMDWCVELGLNVDRIYGRIRRGELPAEALR